MHKLLVESTVSVHRLSLRWFRCFIVAMEMRTQLRYLKQCKGTAYTLCS